MSDFPNHFEENGDQQENAPVERPKLNQLPTRNNNINNQVNGGSSSNNNNSNLLASPLNVPNFQSPKSAPQNFQRFVRPPGTVSLLRTASPPARIVQYAATSPQNALLVRSRSITGPRGPGYLSPGRLVAQSRIVVPPRGQQPGTYILQTGLQQQAATNQNINNGVAAQAKKLQKATKNRPNNGIIDYLLDSIDSLFPQENKAAPQNNTYENPQQQALQALEFEQPEDLAYTLQKEDEEEIKRREQERQLRAQEDSRRAQENIRRAEEDRRRAIEDQRQRDYDQQRARRQLQQKFSIQKQLQQKGAPLVQSIVVSSTQRGRLPLSTAAAATTTTTKTLLPSRNSRDLSGSNIVYSTTAQQPVFAATQKLVPAPLNLSRSSQPVIKYQTSSPQYATRTLPVQTVRPQFTGLATQFQGYLNNLA